MSQQQQIPPFSSSSPPPIDLDFNDDLDFHEEPPPLDDYPIDTEEDLKDAFDNDINDSELLEIPNDFNEFVEHKNILGEILDAEAEDVPEYFDKTLPEGIPPSTEESEKNFKKLIDEHESSRPEPTEDIVVNSKNDDSDEFLEFESEARIVKPKSVEKEDSIETLPVETILDNLANSQTSTQDSLSQINYSKNDRDVNKMNETISNSGGEDDISEERKLNKEVDSAASSSFELEDLDFVIPAENTTVPKQAQDEDDDFTDFSDFNDFKSAPEVQVFQPQAVSFEADFASFDDFQDFSSAQKQPTECDIVNPCGFLHLANQNLEKQPTVLINEPVDIEDDDDFGDFSDFKQATQITTTELNQETFFQKDNLVSVLDMMFPLLSTGIESADFQKNELNQSEIIRNLNDFDTSKALGYQYTSSKSSQTLVKALGIDTRNILHGAQWNSSMPRYAANLSFSPLEPLKPSISSSIHSPKFPSKTQHGLPLPLATEALVPDVQFDWNGAGLVNPLDDGVQEILQERGSTATGINTIPTIFAAEQGKLSTSILDQTTTPVFEETTTKAPTKPEVVIDGVTTPIDSTYQWQKNEAEEESPKLGPFIVSGSNTRTIKLPETHIFTPVKGSSPISQEVISEDLAVPVAVDGVYSKNKILVKEYHDVEYSLEVSKKLEEDNEDDNCEFNDFQSVPAVWSAGTTLSNDVMSKPSILQPHILQENTERIEIKWPEPGNILNTENYSDLTNIVTNSFLDSQVEQQLEKEEKKLSIPVNFKSKEKFSKPTIGKSPTDEADDDFSDFQTAPISSQFIMSTASLQQPMIPCTNHVDNSFTVIASSVHKPVFEPSHSSDPITLSPARLQTNKKMDVAKSIWNNSIDDDEISRIEAAFPKCKIVQKKAVVAPIEEPLDEEWSDFVSLPNETSSIYTSMQNQINTSQNAFTNNTRPVSHNSNDDYWSDFVSVPSKDVNPLPSGRPNFSSWNQPSIAPSLSAFGNYSNDAMLSAGNKVPTTNNFVNITNNFNYNVAPNHHLKQFTNNYQPQQQPETLVKQQRNEIPNISILPGLSFSIPKNRPSSDATKK